MARAAEARHGLPSGLFVAQMRQEADFNPHAVSHKGAQGPAQIRPSTARAWGVNPWDPAAAYDAAAKAMAGYWATYQRQGHSPAEAYRRALAAYNAGPDAVRVHGGVPPYAETRQYIGAILRSEDLNN